MAKFYIFIGQSNSRGAAPNADCHPSLSGEMQNVKIWDGTTFSNFDVGVNQSYPNNDAFHGAAPALVYNEQIRNGGTIYAMMYSIGDSRLASETGGAEDWFPSNSGESCDKAISTFNNALAYAWNTLGIRSYELIFIWKQGEADTSDDAYANAYETNLTNFVNKINANFSGTALTSATKRWMFIKLGTDTSYNATRLATINTAMNTVASNLGTNYRTLDPTGYTLQVDLHHYEASGYKEMGEDLSTAFGTYGW
jgi:hypothetical protein